MTIRTLSFLILCLYNINLLAHDGKKHKSQQQESTTIKALKEKETTIIPQKKANINHGDHHEQSIEKKLYADFDDFPTLHPLVVHFPIVLLLLAAISQFFGFFFFRDALSWTTLVLVSLGFIGAYVAGNYVHPHTSGLSDFAKKVLTEHENYASYTYWFAGLGVIAKLLSQFLFHKKLWTELIVIALLVGASYSVGIAGHYGSQLIHIEGIGAKGQNLETEEHNHQH